MPYPKYIITATEDDGFYFSLAAAGGIVILTSQRYNMKTGALIGIELVRENCPIEGRYDRDRSANDQYYFTLRSNEGNSIGMSEMYYSPATRDHAISLIKQQGTTLEMEDQTRALVGA